MKRRIDFNGRGALVTGASSGIGRLLALRLAQLGARVALVARRQEPLDAVREEITASGGEALSLPCDVGNREEAESCAAKAEAALGGVDLLFNNAGYGRHRSFLDWDVEDMERMMRVNFLGSLYFTKALAPAMAQRGRGTLVFLASVAGRMAPPDESAYAASKFAVVGLSEAISIELEDSGIHVLTVCPGSINTPFFDEEALSRMPPVARRSMVAPEKLVDAIFNSLARGRHQLTYPRSMAAGFISKALAPAFTRRQLRRVTLDAMASAHGTAKNPRSEDPGGQ